MSKELEIDKPEDWLRAPILPVVVVESESQGLAIAEGLLAGGIAQIEITLRTPAALPAMRAIRNQYPEMSLSAGTVLTPEQFDEAAESGAELMISPGLTETLARHVQANGYLWVPGVATASEAMRAMELGFELVKFFPAMAAGGPKALSGIAAPLAGLKAIPTGGVTLENLPQWKALPLVQACGGTWLTTGLKEFGLTHAGISKGVAQRAREAIEAWESAGLVKC